METYKKYLDQQKIANLDQTGPNWGVTILNVGHNAHPANKRYPVAEHPEHYMFDWVKGRTLEEFQLVYIVDGSGEFEAEYGGRITVKPGTVFFLYPGIWHRYRPDRSSGWEEYWVGFKGSFAEHLMNQDCFNNNTPLIHIGFNTEFLNVFIRLIDTLKYEGVAFSQMASCFTIQLLGLVYASAVMKEKTYNRKEHVINNIRYYIHEHWTETINMEELAAQHHESYIWFRKAFKDVIGISPGQYHINLKIEKACQMLRETDRSISEIAFATGFLSEHHFSDLFKKKMKSPPSMFRDNRS